MEKNKPTMGTVVGEISESSLSGGGEFTSGEVEEISHIPELQDVSHTPDHILLSKADLGEETSESEAGEKITEEPRCYPARIRKPVT